MPDILSQNPLISFIIVTYNQEAYIREAVEGALSQTYSPLEIIISDDCSNDGTFDIVKEMVDGYKGKHSVRYNRNPTNIGLGIHLSRLMEECHGELIVVAAGDDISLPDRTEMIYQAWEHSKRKATSIFSSFSIISDYSEILDVQGSRGVFGDQRVFVPLDGVLANYMTTRIPVVNGCTHAWSPLLFKYFGNVNADLEDLVLSFRSLSIGQIWYINKPLVKYRRHGGNVSFLAGKDDTQSFSQREKRLLWVDEQSERAFECMVSDTETLYRNGRISTDDYEQLKRTGNRIKRFYAVEKDMIRFGLIQRILVVARLLLQGDLSYALRFAPRALPRLAYKAIYFHKGTFQQRKR